VIELIPFSEADPTAVRPICNLGDEAVRGNESDKYRSLGCAAATFVLSPPLRIRKTERLRSRTSRRPILWARTILLLRGPNMLGIRSAIASGRLFRFLAMRSAIGSLIRRVFVSFLTLPTKSARDMARLARCTKTSRRGAVTVELLKR
jgi:hypothetical protein